MKTRWQIFSIRLQQVRAFVCPDPKHNDMLCSYTVRSKSIHGITVGSHFLSGGVDQKHLTLCVQVLPSTRARRYRRIIFV